MGGVALRLEGVEVDERFPHRRGGGPIRCNALRTSASHPSHVFPIRVEVDLMR